MTDPNTRRKFEALVAAAFADGFLAEAEKDVLQRKAAELRISSRDVTEIIGLGQQRKLAVAIPSTTAEREALLEDLIEVVCADGRVESPEYHLLARFSETLKIALPDLRSRVNRRMQARSTGNTTVQPRRETVRTPQPPPTPAPRPAAPPPRPPIPADGPAPFLSEQFPVDSSRPQASGPIQLDGMIPTEAKVGEIPPVTLQLLKQSIMFDNEADSLAHIARTLAVDAVEAARVRAAILTAYPDLKPGSQQIRGIRS